MGEVELHQTLVEVLINCIILFIRWELCCCGWFQLNGNICWAGKLLFFWCRCGGGDDELFPPNGLIDINGTGFADCESCWDDCVLLWIYGDCGNISGEGGGILNCEPCWLLNKLDDWS